MENTPPPRRRSPPPSSATVTLLLVLFFCLISNDIVSTHAARVNAPAKSDSFTPPDNYLIDCGNSGSTTLPGNRVFLGDQETSKYLSYNGQDIQVSAPDADSKLPSAIYTSALVFESEATYTFHVTRPGWHWIRLHFAPIQNNQRDLRTAKFKVSTSDNLVLIHEFENPPNATSSFNEYLVNVTTERFSIKFEPVQGSVAFVSAIEFVSAPDILIGDVATAVFPKGDYSGLMDVAYQTVYRLNVGGPTITAQNDTLRRTWDSDKQYLDPKVVGSEVSVEPKVISYPDGESPLIAPPVVYATATEMANANVEVPSFNISWKMKVDSSFQYLVRLHFADIVSKSPNDLYFNVYLNGKPAITGLDLSTVAGGLTSAYFADFVINSTMVSGLDPLTVQVGPMNENADGKKADGSSAVNGTVAAVGFAMMFGAFIGLGAMAVKWKKRPQDWHKSKSFSSWLLPIHAGDTSFMSNSKTSLGSRKSQVFFVDDGIGTIFLCRVTRRDLIISTPRRLLALVDLILSKLRHRHLVSLIGYCDENSEMILVYEFMANGPFRDHLYGKGLDHLTWKQRLEICIGAARGYIIYIPGFTRYNSSRRENHKHFARREFHRQNGRFWSVKDAPTTEQTHVSTAVKGSFGYLDPEYFRKQQLTDKSDVYSFGVVLLEALCARPAINPALPREQVNLAEWAMQWKRKGPTMGDVLWNLEYALQLQEASSQGNSEEENKALASPVVSAAATDNHVAPVSDNNSPISTSEAGNKTPAEVPVIEEHSGTAMFAQFAALNGR
ncbi:hypothetical protein DH2020_044803 [Rehmannia glutinosa]|uniref:Protein kinase domain-containing protein n=1 Tax=Rehmannia glutinosa TaxID=99300 RepID=A0ABR0UG60_REHGL